LIVLTILAILILILNEIYNGNAMMAMYPDIPFHCLVEIFGIACSIIFAVFFITYNTALKQQPYSFEYGVVGERNLSIVV
jgi:hypothetical protein